MPASDKGASSSSTTRDRTVVLVVATMAGFLSAFMSSSVNIALPVIESEFRLSAVVLGWIPLAYIVTFGGALMPAGQLSDLKGRKRVFFWGLVVFTLLSFGGGLAPSASWLIGLRLAQGVGAGMIFATTTALVTAAYPAAERGKALGLQVAGVYLGLTLGPVLGGIITHNVGWRGLFWITGVASFINCVGAAWCLRSKEQMEVKSFRFDAVGSVLYGVSLPAALVGLSFLPGILGIALLVGGVAGLAVFVWWEGSAPSPILPVNLLRHNRAFAFFNTASLINYAATFAMTFLMSMYLQYNRGLTAQTAGLVLVAGAFMQVLVSPLAGRLVDRMSNRIVAGGGMALCVLALLGLAFLTETTPYWYVIGMLCVLGVGFGFFAAPVTHAIMGSVETRHLTVASATVATTRLAGQNLSMGLATLVLVLTVGGREISGSDYTQVLSSVRISFAIFTGLCVVGLIALLAVGRPQPRC